MFDPLTLADTSWPEAFELACFLFVMLVIVRGWPRFRR